MRRTIRLLPLFALLAVPPGTATADDAAMLERVQAFLYERAREHGEEVVIEVSPPSARLPACENPEPFLPNAEAKLRSRVSVGVRCGEAGRQVRYLQAEVHITGTYLEVATEVKRGELLTERRLVERRGDLGRLPARAVLDPEEAVGQEATRRLAPGLTLQAHHLRAPTLVERGDSVLLEATGTGFRAVREAEAIDTGGLGERVRARLPDRQLLEGEVVGEGRLAVDF